jgi:hypothetical protein
MLRPRRLTALALATVAAAGLSACGNGHQEDETAIRAHTEGIYLKIGGLKYQVQISRQLNPFDTEDRAYLQGIPAAQRDLKPGEVWFGVFLRVQNDDEKGPALAPASDISIHDTQENVYRPIPLAPTNVFAYRSSDIVPPGGLIPEPDSVPSETTIQGALTLFKLTNQSLDNRPLEMVIEGRGVPKQTGTIDLDV